MKRKLLMIVLSVALTLTLIPTLAAYADDEFNQNETPDQILEDVQGEEDVPDVEDVPDANIEEGDLDEGEALEVELPKINLKSPVTQMSQADVNKTTYTLEARVGEQVIAPDLIIWSSDNVSVATISPEGVVSIVGVGKANFTAVMKVSTTLATARNGYAKVFVFADKTKAEVQLNDNLYDGTDFVAPSANSNGKKHK
jgi:hypothetical protein